jgi:hypothetical protein
MESTLVKCTNLVHFAQCHFIVICLFSNFDLDSPRWITYFGGMAMKPAGRMPLLDVPTPLIAGHRLTFRTR